MPNYSMALGIRPAQIDAARPFAIAAQQRQAQVSEQNALAQQEIARARLGLSQEQFGMQKKMHQATLDRAEGQSNALSQYNEKSDIDALAAYPEMQGKVLGNQDKIRASEQAESEQRAMRHGRRAQRVLGMPEGEQRQRAWDEELKGALDAGDLDQASYERYAATPPNELLLNNLMQQAVPLEKIYADQAPTSTQKNVDAVIDDPGRYPTGSEVRGAMLGNKGPTVQVVTGDHANLGKAARGQIETSAYKSQEQLARLNTIKSGFKKEFLQLPYRAGMTLANFKEKLGRDLSSGEQRALSDYTEFRTGSVSNLNKLLNELSGAAVSPQEYVRIAASQPDAGTGVWDGDGPTSFDSKLNANIKDLTRVIARQHYVLKNNLPGKPWEVMGLGQVDKFINKRGGEIMEELKAANPGAEEAALKVEAKIRLRSEFGIGAGGTQ